MKTQNSIYEEALVKFAGLHCHKILKIDITADTFETLSVGDFEWAQKIKELPSKKISEWFQWFADGPLCYEKDRERFKAFTSLRNLKDTFEQSDFAAASIVYRRRFDLSDRVYSTVSMELIPQITENGHLMAFLFVRNISAEIINYTKRMENALETIRNPQSKKYVLVIEDNEMNREILTEILSGDYTVLQAENGAVGLEMLQKYMAGISVVILDVQMPVMNGFEFLERKRQDPFLAKIPVIVATGSDSRADERKCLQLGALEFIRKPYFRDIILARIDAIIRLRESVDAMSKMQTDDRTGLFTLQAFYYYTRFALDKNPDKPYTITIFEVDRFKSINESYGESVGDAVLLHIAEVLKDYTAASDIHGRFDGARFLLLSETLPPGRTDEWINGLFASLQSRCGLKGITFKAGIYDNVDKKLSIAKICDHAILALNSCRQDYQNRYCMYDKSHIEKEMRIAVMESSMQDALDKEQFAVYYQPKHDAISGKLAGAEALIRWIHPEYGFLSPAEFIPLFERNGFISNVDFYVLNRTCRNLKAWIGEGLSLVPVSVNASRRDFDRDNFLDKILQPIRENMMDPSLIHIEVTESLFSDRLEELGSKLQQCRNAGFHIELDDFGAGYSSLTTLVSLPIDVMKLDMSFMRKFDDKKNLRILKTCIRLAKNLRLKTVSEGVETEEQLELLKAYGCDMIQGYYFSKPLPEEEFKEYLRKYS